MLFIDGKWETASSGRTFDSRNPANGEKLGEVADADRKDAERAVQAAQEAFAGWSRTTVYERSALLYEAWRIMTARREELAELMTAEQGKPLRMARNEVDYAADFLLWFAEEAKRVYGETIPSARADQRFVVMRQPIGVAAAITPWNYPVSMLTRKIAPAVAAGCTMVLKPAEQTPLCAVEMFRILEEAGFPPGVVNLVTTSDPIPVGDELLTNPSVRKLTFTGSTEVGKQIARRAADQLKRVSLELGGHAPFIVFADADPAHAAKGAALVKFLNTGQACICPNRIFVHRSVAEPFVAELTARVGQAPCRQRPGTTASRSGRSSTRRHGQDGAPGGRRGSPGRHRGHRRRPADAATSSTPALLRARRCSPASPLTWSSTGKRPSGRSPRSSSSTTKTRSLRWPTTPLRAGLVHLHQRPRPGHPGGRSSSTSASSASTTSTPPRPPPPSAA